MVLIEVPTSATQMHPPTTSAPDCDDTYSVHPPQHVAAPPLPNPSPSPSSDSAQARVEPPVVWTSGGCSRSPTILGASEPAAFSFELASPPTPNKPAVVVGILPFSATKREETPVVSAEKDVRSETQSPVNAVPTQVSKSETSATHHSGTEETPGRPKQEEETPGNPAHASLVSAAVPIPTSNLSYSTTYNGAASRTVSTSPPEQSYACSPPKESSLTYSQASRGSGFAHSQVGSSAHTYAGPAYAGPASSTSSYAGAVSSIEPYSTSV